MNTKNIRGLASIIVPCWNQIPFTRQCVGALKSHTRQPWELIVIDNGSTDHTDIYLAGVQDGAAVSVTVISNTTNQGFPAAINQGLKAARGEYLVMLNNDVVVTDGWLDQLVALANMGIRGGATPPPSEDPIISCAETTPPGPPFTRGGKCSPSEVIDVDGARRGPTIGLVGPMSNYAAPPQLVESVPYHDLRAMHNFARQWRDEHRGKWFTARKLSGFCLLMKRAVYETIGGLDERFGIGFFDDDDLAERARRAGFLLAVAHDLFVHHFGSRTFQGNGIDAEKLLDENASRFAAKWGLAAANGKRVALRPWSDVPAFFAESQRAFARDVDECPSEHGEDLTQSRKAAKNANGAMSKSSGDVHDRLQTDRPAQGQVASDSVPSTSLAPLRLCVRSSSSTDGADAPIVGERARISLTMIVRDEEENLANCLASVRGIFDEIVIVDTGSVDRTKEIAREFGAKVFDFVRVDDFAAARNESLSHATGDYAFWLDADDVVEPVEREKLRALLAALAPHSARLGASPARTEPHPPGANGAAYVVRCACAPSHDGTKGETVVDHVRLFPLRPDVRWTYRVHEQILPSLNRAKVPVRWPDLMVRHTGYVDPVVEARKLDRNIKILERELEERPDDPFVLFNLGASSVEKREWHEALGFLGRSLAGSAPTDSIVRKLYALIARVHQMMGNSQEALRTCAERLNFDPEDAELWFRKAVVHRHRGESAEAERCWRLILNLKRPDQFCSFDQGIYGHLTRRNLAALAAERGDHAGAERLWTDILAECPGDGEALAKLGRLQGVTSRHPQRQSDDAPGPWIIPGSRRPIVPSLGTDDFAPYAPVAKSWIKALEARVVVELGVRFGHSTRALLEGARAVDGQVWGVDPLERHDVSDDLFTFIQADPFKVAARWERIDLLHIDIDLQCEGDARRWLAEYANRCRAIAVHHTHHPGYRLGPVIAELAASDQWQVFEYRGNLGGWTVLARRGETSPVDVGATAAESGPGQVFADR